MAEKLVHKCPLYQRIAMVHNYRTTHCGCDFFMLCNACNRPRIDHVYVDSLIDTYVLRRTAAVRSEAHKCLFGPGGLRYRDNDNYEVIDGRPDKT